ncbi:MAG: serine/threonine-protein kinase [Pseudomonadota bacterium]
MQFPGYQIQEEIGQGGMATVYLAVQESLNRSVVLKILDKVKRSESEDLAQRFVDEGKIIASLHHPNIVTIYDIGLSDGDLYISMEYVEGGDLKQRMQRSIRPQTALDIVMKVGSALASAHAHKVIHRDVKPANILFRDEKTPLLTDFGIAKQTDTEQDLTSTGIFLGSPNYVSPEQADGAAVDGRTDIYSLGCIFYEMLTGYKPYKSNSVIDIVIQHKTAAVPTLPQSLSEYQPLLEKMMAKKLDERFATADELVAEIDKIIIKEKTEPGLVSPSSEAPETKQSKKKKTMTVLIILLILSGAFFFGLQYVEIRIKREPTVAYSPPPVDTVITSPLNISNELAAEEGIIENTVVAEAEPVSDEILKALEWLGKQSLTEFKLNYPPKDNAYYYFSKLLEIQPGSQAAVQGILNIADRYAILAERSLANNELEKTKTYIELGLKIDPQNQALLSLKELVNSQNKGILSSLKSLFN